MLYYLRYYYEIVVLAVCKGYYVGINKGVSIHEENTRSTRN